MAKDFKGHPVRILDDVPPRTFDLLPRFVKNFGGDHVMFAARTPDGWDKYDGDRMSELTDAVSLGLMKIGVKKGDRVAIVANSCPQWNIADFAIQQLGAITVPIYPTISHNDYDYNFHHAEPKVVFIDGKMLYKNIEDILKTVSSIEKIYAVRPVEGLDSFDDLINLGRENKSLLPQLEEAKRQVQTDDVATILYTSGTMGTPKGVQLTHRNLMSDVEFYCPHYPIESTDDAISYLPLSHIYERSVQLSHVYIGVGNYYVESLGSIMRDIAEVKPQHFTSVPRLIEKMYITIMRKGEKLTGMKKKIFDWAFKLADLYDETGRTNSNLFKLKLALADKLVFQEVKKVFGGKLELIISGGASIQPRLVRTFAAMGVHIVEGYGLSETSPVIVTNSLVTGRLKAGTVGTPISSVHIKVDPTTGEILVKGSCVMKGYFKDEEKTREAIDEEGYFHTGDRGMFDEDGMLRITGRIKEIFKDSMGKYISPALIENKFAESQMFNGMMVVGENQKYAAALIVPNFEWLRSWCRENNISYTTNEEMVKMKEVLAVYRTEVEKYNKYFGDFERIKKFCLMPREWTIEAGEITPSLKIRRKTISEHFASEIQDLFAE